MPFSRLRNSLLARLVALIFLLVTTIVGLLDVAVAMRVVPMVRAVATTQAEAAVNTTISYMSPEDQTAIREGRPPSAEALARLEQTRKTYGYDSLVFWRRGVPYLEIGQRVMGPQAREVGKLVMERSSSWKKQPTSIKVKILPVRRAFFTFPTRGLQAEPISAVIPYSVLTKRIISYQIGTCLIPPLVAVFIGILPGMLAFRLLTRYFRDLSLVAEEAAAGRLRTEIPELRSDDSLGDLHRDIITMQKSLGSLVSNIVQAANEVESSTQSLSEAARDASHSSQSMATTMGEMTIGISELATTIHQTTEAIADMTIQVNRSTAAAETATGLAQETMSATDAGLAVVTAAVGEVGGLTQHVHDLASVASELRVRSNEIREVVQFIASVAEQTSLLALNASIEAAHAGGESGSTFGILAERIQALSSDAAAAGEKIGKHIQGILEQVNRVDETASGSIAAFDRAAEVVQEAGQLFHQIGAMVRGITAQSESVSRSGAMIFGQAEQASAQMQSIATFSEEMAASAEEVSAAAEEQAATSEQVGKTAEELAKMANGLRRTSSKFVV